MDGLRRVQIDRQRVIDATAPVNCPTQPGGLVVAYSGGPDSTVLLHALAHAGYRVPVRAVHVCHNLQPEAQRWVNHCRDYCSRLGITFQCLDVHVDYSHESLEAAARQARYDALRAALADGEVLALAQHANDQAETFLIQALRGTGVDGLAAMPVEAAFGRGHLWRPLLGLPRQTLLAYGREHALDWVEDASNRDRRLDRGYLREMIWPALDAHWPAASRTLSRTARWCAEAGGLITEITQADAAALTDARQRLEVDGLSALSAFRQGNVLRYWLASRGVDAPDHRHVEQIRRLLTARAHASPRVQWDSTEVRRFDDHLYALPTLPPVPSTEWQTEWFLDRVLQLPHGCGQLTAVFEGQPCETLTVRFRRGGERYADSRRGGTRTLKALLQEARIPPWWRQRLPLVFLHGQLVAVADYWCDPELEQTLGLSSLRFTWHMPGRL